MRQKRGQEMSIQVIVVAAIALLVLVILAIIFVGKLGKTRQEVDRCENYGGTCKVACDGSYERMVRSYDCNNDNDENYNEGPETDGVCCISV